MRAPSCNYIACSRGGGGGGGGWRLLRRILLCFWGNREGGGGARAKGKMVRESAMGRGGWGVTGKRSGGDQPRYVIDTGTRSRHPLLCGSYTIDF